MVSGTAQCICTKGYTGNPFSACVDIDECSAANCGQNAVCINIPGSYDCRCKKDYIGNPYQICTEENDEERDDLCQTQQCGPNAVCNLGKVNAKSVNFLIISTGFKFQRSVWECSVHSCSCPCFRLI